MGSKDSPPLADWLALREAADFASRSERLTRLVAGHLGTSVPARILDLGTGTGSNLRYLLEHLPRQQHWTVVDRDPAVLGHLQARTASWAAARGYSVAGTSDGFVIAGKGLECQVTPRQQDLGSVDDATLFEGEHLVTASALLDLVSPAWLNTVARHCRSAGAAALFTITYDGRSPCAPSDPDDDIVRELFNRHQRTDKGLGGPAAGPDAAALAAAVFEEAGFRVEREHSDWVIEPSEQELQKQLIIGWASAATEMAPEIATQIANWRLRRLHHVAAGDSLIVVGHEDLFAAP
ncbi:MAG: cyclopropane-fatty-acyl-phospholipid synthase family protein [Vicinamibacterales bacterium]